MDDAELERLAREEILREAKRGAERAKEMGSTGWLRPRVPPTNKRFLHNIITSTVSRDHRLKRRRSQTSSKDSNDCSSSSDECRTKSGAASRQFAANVSGKDIVQKRQREERLGSKGRRQNNEDLAKSTLKTTNTLKPR